MGNVNFWDLFRETGEPVCYLLYKASGCHCEDLISGQAVLENIKLNTVEDKEASIPDTAC